MACTTILVGKDASYDGSTIVARNEDSPGGQFEPKRMQASIPAWNRTSPSSFPRNPCATHRFQMP